MRFLLVLAAASLLSAENWPQFRGPGAMGVADGAKFPEKWSETENVAWKTPVPGVGWSSPVVWGDRLYLTSVTTDAQLEALTLGHAPAAEDLHLPLAHLPIDRVDGRGSHPNEDVAAPHLGNARVEADSLKIKEGNVKMA